MLLRNLNRFIIYSLSTSNLIDIICNSFKIDMHLKINYLELIMPLIRFSDENDYLYNVKKISICQTVLYSTSFILTSWWNCNCIIFTTKLVSTIASIISIIFCLYVPYCQRACCFTWGIFVVYIKFLGAFQSLPPNPIFFIDITDKSYCSSSNRMIFFCSSTDSWNFLYK